MKATGYIRRLDQLGRITLPKQLRNQLKLSGKSKIEMYTEGNAIVLKKYQLKDAFTGDTDDLVEKDGLYISRKNIKKLCELAGIEIL
jgi:transcriptional pleiotropic regulator of transition state genes